MNILLGNAGNWQTTLNNVAGDHPDFDIDLGDTTAMDNGNTSVGSQAEAEQVYKDTLPYLNTVSASAPLFMVPGNHEQQEAWHGITAADDLPIMGKNAEKKFFLNPVPNSFYSGDSRTISLLSGDHLVQDYYSWTWGDALFVVIIPYWTTTTKPYTTSTGGGEGDTTGSGDRWDWTLGADQFNWLKTDPREQRRQVQVRVLSPDHRQRRLGQPGQLRPRRSSTPPTSASGAATTPTAPPTRGAPTVTPPSGATSPSAR